MSNLYQMMCQTGSLPTPKQRNIGSPAPAARWSDVDPDTVCSPVAAGSNRAPSRMPQHEESPISTLADARDIFWRPSSKDDGDVDSNGFLRSTSSGTFEQRYGMQLADCDDEISIISDPMVMLLGHDGSGNSPKAGLRLPLIGSETTQSVTSSEDSTAETPSETPEYETVRRRVMDDLSIYTDQEDFVFEDDDTEVSPEFAQCFPSSMDLLESDSFDVKTHASLSDSDTVCDASLGEVEAFTGDLWAEMHSKTHSPITSSESRKQTKYNRYRDLQAPHKKEEVAPHRFEHFTDISGEAKTQNIYERLDEKVQQLLMGNRDDIETLQYHLDVMKLSTPGKRKKYPSPRTESMDSIDPIESSTNQPIFTKRCPTLDEVRRQEAKYLASLSTNSRPSAFVYSPKIEADGEI